MKNLMVILVHLLLLGGFILGNIYNIEAAVNISLVGVVLLMILSVVGIFSILIAEHECLQKVTEDNLPTIPRWRFYYFQTPLCIGYVVMFGYYGYITMSVLSVIILGGSTKLMYDFWEKARVLKGEK